MTVRRWRETSFGPLLAWFLVLVAIAIGSRTYFDRGVPTVGEFLRFPESARELAESYGSAWDPRSFGLTSPVPSGWLALAVLSGLALFRMGLAMTLSVVGLFVIGAAGMWRLAAVFPANRSRISAMVVYVATPLVPGVLATGRWSVLVWYAALPWMVYLLRRAVGIGTADPDTADEDLVDGIGPTSRRDRLRYMALSSLVLGLTATFAPVTIVLWLGVGLALSAATLIAGGSIRTAGWLAATTGVAVVVAAALNLPWATTWSWSALVGPSIEGPRGDGLVDVASLALDGRDFAVLAIALYVPVVVAARDQPGLASDLGGARRRARAGVRCVGGVRRSRRAAVRRPRAGDDAGARRARPRARVRVGDRCDRRRRPRTRLRLAPARGGAGQPGDRGRHRPRHHVDQRWCVGRAADAAPRAARCPAPARSSGGRLPGAVPRRSEGAARSGSRVPRRDRLRSGRRRPARLHRPVGGAGDRRRRGRGRCARSHRRRLDVARRRAVRADGDPLHRAAPDRRCAVDRRRSGGPPDGSGRVAQRATRHQRDVRPADHPGVHGRTLDPGDRPADGSDGRCQPSRRRRRAGARRSRRADAAVRRQRSERRCDRRGRHRGGPRGGTVRRSHPAACR